MKPLSEWRPSAVLERLAERGWCWIRTTEGEAASPNALNVFGRVRDEALVRLDPEVRSYVCAPDPVPPHTDHPSVDIIAWSCDEQDSDDGANLLLDSRAILKGLSSVARRDLTRTLLPSPPLEPGPVGLWPVLASDGGVFFAPWIEPIAMAVEDGFKQFRTAVGESWKDAVEVRLLPGDALLIDNRRILHGRRALHPHSRRRLRRWWIENREPWRHPSHQLALG
jgi:hypothetical protein